MIMNAGAFGKSPNQRTVNPQPTLTEEGIAKASRNHKIFNRAIYLIMNEWGHTREETLEWLDDDTNDTWVAHNEANPSKPI